MLQEAFAVVREASKRVLGLRPFDVQLIGKRFMYDIFVFLAWSFPCPTAVEMTLVCLPPLKSCWSVTSKLELCLHH